jgi:hypothetical protein
MSDTPQTSPPGVFLTGSASSWKALPSMVICWGVIGGGFGFHALAGGDIARASAITWFVAAGAVAGIVATGVSRLLPDKSWRVPGQAGGRSLWTLLPGGALTGGVVLALLGGWLLGKGWGSLVFFSLFGFLMGTVLGVGGSLFSIVMAEYGPLRMLWWTAQGQARSGE